MTLAIETSTEAGSVALGNGAEMVREIAFHGAGQRRHSTLLFSALEELKLPEIKVERIIIGLGPGSFSGVRVALAAAQAIALVKEATVYGICSAFSVAEQKKEVTRLGVFADARRGEFYETIFQNGKLERATFLISPAQLEIELSKLTLAVSAEKLPGIDTFVTPRARDFLLFPVDFSACVHGPDLEPIYLRDSYK